MPVIVKNTYDKVSAWDDVVFYQPYMNGSKKKHFSDSFCLHTFTLIV